MKKEDLHNLLTDLYTIYNPEHLQHVDVLTEKYHRMEHSAVEMILVKYNHKNSPFYDPEISKDEYVVKLIKEYENGNRSLHGVTPKILKKPSAEDVINENAQKITTEVDKKIDTFKSEIQRKNEELSNLVSKYEKILSDLSEKVTNQKPTTSYFDIVDIKINLFYTESKVQLPNKEVLACLGIGARILVINAENKPIGLEVKDITYDCVSNVMFGGRPTLEITLDKV